MNFDVLLFLVVNLRNIFRWMLLCPGLEVSFFCHKILLQFHLPSVFITDYNALCPAITLSWIENDSDFIFNTCIALKHNALKSRTI